MKRNRYKPVRRYGVCKAIVYPKNGSKKIVYLSSSEDETETIEPASLDGSTTTISEKVQITTIGSESLDGSTTTLFEKAQITTIETASLDCNTMPLSKKVQTTKAQPTSPGKICPTKIETKLTSAEVATTSDTSRQSKIKRLKLRTKLNL